MLRRFLSDRRGNFMIVTAIIIVPLICAVGLGVDYSSAVSNKSDMQNALDAATLSLTTMAKDATDNQRAQQLQAFYEGNGGRGQTSVDDVTFDDDGTLHVATSAQYDMPTNFTRLAAIDEVPLGISTKLTKNPSLIEANFKLNKASGWWDKTISLYGNKFDGDNDDYEKLLEIDYEYNGFGDPKGYGTTTVYTVDGQDWRGRDRLTRIQRQVCDTKTVGSFRHAPEGSIQQTSGNTKYLTTCVTDPKDGSGAAIDVSKMEDLYLRMDVPSGNPKILETNDPETSDRLFIDGKEVERGKRVDIFTAVPCGETATQAWEDGGSSVPGPVKDADFFYDVTGKCDYTQHVARTHITR